MSQEQAEMKIEELREDEAEGRAKADWEHYQRTGGGGFFSGPNPYPIEHPGYRVYEFTIQDLEYEIKGWSPSDAAEQEYG